MQEDTDKANKHSSVLERDNQRMEIQIKDLSQQVRIFVFLLFFFLPYANCPVVIEYAVSKIELPYLKCSTVRNPTLAEL